MIIDILNRVRQLSRSRGDRQLEDYRSIQPLVDLANETPGLAIAIVVHTRKVLDEDFINDVAGSLGITGAVTNALVIKRARGGSDGVLLATGKNIPYSEHAMRFHDDSLQWEYLGLAEAHRAGTTRQRIVEILREEGRPMTPAQIAECDDSLRKSTVRGTCCRMFRVRTLIREGNGRYGLPEDQVDDVLSPDAAESAGDDGEIDNGDDT